jgi:hypothetical protein
MAKPVPKCFYAEKYCVEMYFAPIVGKLKSLLERLLKPNVARGKRNRSKPVKYRDLFRTIATLQHVLALDGPPLTA